MKTISVCILLLAVVSVYSSCRKSETTSDAPVGLSGRWNIVVDSFPEGFAADNHLVAYTGRDGDYYDFRSDSTLHVKEGSDAYVYYYHILSDSTLSLTPYGNGTNTAYAFYSILHLTSHSVTLTDPWVYTPGGTFGRVVYLKR